MRNGKKKKVIISAACIIVMGLLIAGIYVYRLGKQEYPVIKKIKVSGENYIREIYPEVEIRYPEVVVDEDSKEYLGTYKFKGGASEYSDNEKINRRKTMRYSCLAGAYEADNIQSLKMRVANAAGVITTKRSIKSDKGKKERYTSTWVDIDMDDMIRTEENKNDNAGPWLCFITSVPSKRINAEEFRTIVPNAEEAAEVDNVNKCVIEAKITYKDGKEEIQYFMMETESRSIVTNVKLYKVNIK